MAQAGDAIFLLVEGVLIVSFFVSCICSACLRRQQRANEQGHPRAPVVAAPPPPLPRYQGDERLSAPVVLAHFPYAARARAASEPPPVCAICLDELRQGQLCSEVPACRHIFHEGCIRVWAKKKNSCPLCRARVVLPRAAYGVASADDMV
ncbi:hypothetical protein SETIT_4G114900v2 [Setaria italica]|uniref:RING-type E3 ubiquitin transferase n=1 Tax=Setaria italica TaxID=4555 RepID=K3Y1V3_SETIT|nr:E3 ubiquitin-protein ligase RNF181 [Setaria italica]RCV21150.1 hypothetical protein SETIT_4G114900v2 [Setaria italica]